jgi:carbon monoxide dehydrogenase subunit G
MMQYSSSVELHVTTQDVFPYVSDLSQYLLWMPLIHHVEEVNENTWKVELRAKVGVFARSKRLTMVRTVQESSRLVFERQEDDGRTHAPWIMEVNLVQTQGGCNVTIELTYGGNLWTAGVLDKILAHQVDLGKKSLAELVAHSL